MACWSSTKVSKNGPKFVEGGWLVESHFPGKKKTRARMRAATARR